jgi:hypothetical protein
MNEGYEKLKKSIDHLAVFHDFFSDDENFTLPDEQVDFDTYNENYQELTNTFDELGLFDQLYNQKSRQMLLADVIEYIFLGRGYYSMAGKNRADSENKFKFIKGILHFVNLLMCYESITVEVNRRNALLAALSERIPEISDEETYEDLLQYEQEVGTPDSEASRSLSRYFDKLLPKTAGGLWHELLVYIYLIREDLGFIIPLLLHQKLFSLGDHIVPPDFLIISHDKRIFGIEVGIKKEIQSGSFSLKTAIPTATVDTINSRNSDRCPSCKKWIGFCPHVIDNYSDPDFQIENNKVNCMQDCSIYTREQVARGDCKYSKYARNRARTLDYTHHEFADNKHYHYQCVLNNVEDEMRENIVEAQDETAIKTHYPQYSGLEELS